MLCFSKGNNKKKKYNDKYFVILNAKYNSLFMFEKDVSVVWSYIGENTTFENLLEGLKKDGYCIDESELHSLIENLARCGAIECEQIAIDDKFISENNQIDYYIDSCANRSIPTVIHIEITNICNLKCMHCFHDEKGSTIPVENLVTMFEELRNSSFVRAVITGGEPLLHSNWRDIVAAARRNGFIVYLFSNIFMLNDNDIEFIKKENISLVRTSLYSCLPATHDTITQVKGSFDATYKNILKLKNKKVPISVSCSIINENFGDIIAFDNLMKEVGIKISYSWRIIRSIKGTKDINKIMIDNNKFKILYERGLVQTPKKIKCRPGSYRIAIGSDGSIYGCDTLRVPIGNIKTTGVLSSIEGESLKKLRDIVSRYNPEDCKTCVFQEKCTRCPGLVWTELEQPNIHDKLQSAYMQIACV